MRNNTGAKILENMESRGARPYMRLIAGIVIFAFTWVQILPAGNAQELQKTPEVRSAEESQTYIDQRQAPSTDYSPLRQRFEDIQRLQGKEIEQAQKRLRQEENFEIQVYTNLDNLFRNLAHVSYAREQTAQQAVALRQYNITRTIENLGNVLPLHYFRKEGTYTEYVNGLPYRSERTVPNEQGMILFEETFYAHNADRLLTRTVANGYVREGGMLIYTTTSDIISEPGSVWYARNSGPNPTSAYNLTKEITQVTQDFRDNYTTTTHVIYNNDMSLKRATSWREIITDTRFGLRVTEVDYSGAIYNENNQLTGVTKDYKQTTTDPDTKQVVILKEWSELWSGISYVDAEGQLMSSYDITITDEDGIQTIHRENDWDIANGRLAAYQEVFTDYFGAVTTTQRDDITYSQDGTDSYNETTRTYQVDKDGNVILDTTRTTRRTSSQYADGKLTGYSEEMTDENGLHISRKFQDLVWDMDQLVGYTLEEFREGGVEGEYLSEYKYVLFKAELDKYGRKTKDIITTRTVSGTGADGKQVETSTQQAITYQAYDTRGRALAYTSVSVDEKGIRTTEAISNIVYYKGQISQYTMVRTNSAEPGKTEYVSVLNEFDQYGRAYKVTEIVRTTGKTAKGLAVDVTTKTVTEIDQWDQKGRRAHFVRTTTSTDAPDKATSEDISITYDAASQVKTEKIITREQGKDAQGNIVLATEKTKETFYYRDSAGNVVDWMSISIDEFGTKTVETSGAGEERPDAAPGENTQIINELGLVESSQAWETYLGQLRLERTQNGYNTLGQLRHYTKNIYEYDAKGNLARQTRENVDLKYDALGRVIEQKTAAIADGVLMVTVEKITGFDNLGLPLGTTRQRTDDAGNSYNESVVYSYDNFVRINHVESSWSASYGEGWRKEDIYYNSMGQVASKYIREENPQDTFYDVVPGAEWQAYGVNYTYDIYGRVTSEIANGKSARQFFTSSISYTYDGAYLVEKKLTRYDSTSSRVIEDISAINTIEDSASLMTTQITERYKYEKGRLVDKYLAKSRGTLKRTPEGYFFNRSYETKRGDSEESSEHTHYEYDNRANVIKTTQDTSEKYIEDGKGYKIEARIETEFAYDKNDLRAMADTFTRTTDSKDGWVYERDAQLIQARDENGLIETVSQNYIKLGESGGNKYAPKTGKSISLAELKQLIKQGDWNELQNNQVGFYSETRTITERDSRGRATQARVSAVNQYGVASESIKTYEYNSKGQVKLEKTVEDTVRHDKDNEEIPVQVTTTISDIKYDAKGRRTSWSVRTRTHANYDGWQEEMNSRINAANAKINEINAKINELKAEIKRIKETTPAVKRVFAVFNPVYGLPIEAQVAIKKIEDRINSVKKERNKLETQLKTIKSEYINDETVIRKSTSYFNSGPWENLERSRNEYTKGKGKGSTEHIDRYNLLKQVTSSHNKQGRTTYAYDILGNLTKTYTRISYSSGGVRYRGYSTAKYTYNDYGEITKTESHTHVHMKTTSGWFTRRGSYTSHEVTNYNYLGSQRTNKYEHTRWNDLGGWAIAVKVAVNVVCAVITVILGILTLPIGGVGALAGAALTAGMNIWMEGTTGEAAWKSFGITMGVAIVGFGIGWGISEIATSVVTEAATSTTVAATAAGTSAAVTTVVSEEQRTDAMNDENYTGDEAFRDAMIVGFIGALVSGFTAGFMNAAIEAGKKAIETVKQALTAIANMARTAFEALAKQVAGIIFGATIQKIVQDYLNRQKERLKEKYGEGSEKFEEAMEDAQFKAQMWSGLAGIFAGLTATVITMAAFYIARGQRAGEGFMMDGRYYKNAFALLFDKPYDGVLDAKSSEYKQIMENSPYKNELAQDGALSSIDNAELHFVNGVLVHWQVNGAVNTQKLGQMGANLENIFSADMIAELTKQEEVNAAVCHHMNGNYLIVKLPENADEAGALADAYKKYAVGGGLQVLGARLDMDMEGNLIKGQQGLVLGMGEKKSAGEIKDSLAKLSGTLSLEKDGNDRKVVELLNKMPRENNTFEFLRISINQNAQESSDIARIFATLNIGDISSSTRLGELVNRQRIEMGNRKVILEGDSSGALLCKDEYGRPMGAVLMGKSRTTNEAAAELVAFDRFGRMSKITNYETGKLLAERRALTEIERADIIQTYFAANVEGFDRKFKVEDVEALVSAEKGKDGKYLVLGAVEASVEIIDVKIRQAAQETIDETNQAIAKSGKAARVTRLDKDDLRINVVPMGYEAAVMITSGGAPLLQFDRDGTFVSFTITRDLATVPSGVFDAAGNKVQSYNYTEQGQVESIVSQAPSVKFGAYTIPLAQRAKEGKYVLDFENGVPKIEKGQVAFVQDEEAGILEMAVWAGPEKGFISIADAVKDKQAAAELEAQIKGYMSGFKNTPAVLAALHHGLGDIYRDRPDYPRAKEHFAQAVTYNPEDAQAVYNIAEIDQANRLTAQAKQNFEKAAKIFMKANRFDMAEKAASMSGDKELLVQVRAEKIRTQELEEKTRRLFSENRQGLEYSAGEIEDIKSGLASANRAEFLYAVARLNSASVNVKQKIAPVIPRIQQQFRAAGNITRFELINAVMFKGLGPDMIRTRVTPMLAPAPQAIKPGGVATTPAPTVIKPLDMPKIGR